MSSASARPRGQTLRCLPKDSGTAIRLSSYASLSVAKLARNAACPCGSGRKYKHCCLPDEQQLVRLARIESELGGRIAAWSARQHGDELETAFAEFQPDGRPWATRSFSSSSRGSTRTVSCGEAARPSSAGVPF